MATTFLQVKNNAESTLASDITDVATSLTVAGGEGSKFPSVFPFHISIDDEIIKVGARSGDTLSSLTRAQEGTSAAAHSSGAGVELRITAQQMSDVHTAVNTLEDASHAKYTDAEAISAVPFVIYIPFGTEQSYAPP